MRHAARGDDPEQLPGCALDDDERLAVGVASMPFRLKPRDELEVARQLEGLAAAGGAPFFESARRYSTSRFDP